MRINYHFGNFSTYNFFNLLSWDVIRYWVWELVNVCCFIKAGFFKILNFNENLTIGELTVCIKFLCGVY